MTEQERIDVVCQKIEKACDNFRGDTAFKTVEFVRQLAAEYAAALSFSQADVIETLEEKRTYSAPNYYQRANFPSLDGVRVFETLNDFRSAIPSKQFRCPCCEGVSTDPYECNSGQTVKSGSVCDWKAYGLFKTLGKGAHIVVKEGFLENPKVHDIFMPLEFEQQPIV